mmetsp:Transcript_15659/g.41261  ORF Transcript_15659/g.41261 Transcript_15659/m.41261 type:complete len:238 (-) Transcript_15659:752-1465(-)
MSTCSKGRKMAASLPLAMPIPVSSTITATRLPASNVRADTLIMPRLVNFAALPSRLFRIWMIRPVSPSTVMRGDTVLRSSTSEVLMSERVRSSTSSTTWRSTTTSCFSTSLFWRRAAASMTSLMRASSRAPLVRMMQIWCRTCSGIIPQQPDSMPSLMPMMPFRGVRSSWLTLLMKRSFCSSSRFSSSISFCLLLSSMLRIAVSRRASMPLKLLSMSVLLNITLAVKSQTKYKVSSV